jgi:hypothetical protein
MNGRVSCDSRLLCELFCNVRHFVGDFRQSLGEGTVQNLVQIYLTQIWGGTSPMQSMDSARARSSLNQLWLPSRAVKISVTKIGDGCNLPVLCA